MTKNVSSYGHDHNFMMLLAAAVVVILAIVVLSWGGVLGVIQEPKVDGASTEYTPSDLMQQLQGTVDDGGNQELLQLKSEASGL